MYSLIKRKIEIKEKFINLSFSELLIGFFLIENYFSIYFVLSEKLFVIFDAIIETKTTFNIDINNKYMSKTIRFLFVFLIVMT